MPKFNYHFIEDNEILLKKLMNIIIYVFNSMKMSIFIVVEPLYGYSYKKNCSPRDRQSN